MESFYHTLYGHADKNGSLVLFLHVIGDFKEKTPAKCREKGFFLLEKDKEST